MGVNIPSGTLLDVFSVAFPLLRLVPFTVAFLDKKRKLSSQEVNITRARTYPEPESSFKASRSTSGKS